MLDRERGLDREAPVGVLVVPDVLQVGSPELLQLEPRSARPPPAWQRHRGRQIHLHVVDAARSVRASQGVPPADPVAVDASHAPAAKVRRQAPEGFADLRHGRADHREGLLLERQRDAGQLHGSGSAHARAGTGAAPGQKRSDRGDRQTPPQRRPPHSTHVGRAPIEHRTRRSGPSIAASCVKMTRTAAYGQPLLERWGRRSEVGPRATLGQSAPAARSIAPRGEKPGAGCVRAGVLGRPTS